VGWVFAYDMAQLAGWMLGGDGVVLFLLAFEEELAVALLGCFGLGVVDVE